jgi:hypothetical protein
MMNSAAKEELNRFYYVCGVVSLKSLRPRRIQRWVWELTRCHPDYGAFTV